MRARSSITAVALAALTACSDQPFTIDVPLRVVAVEPSAEARGVARDDLVVRVTFSEEIAADSIDGAFTLEATGGELGSPEAPLAVEAVTAMAKGEANVVTLTPAALLAYSTDYRLTIATAVERERDDGPLPVQVQSLFATEDPPPLRVVEAQPGPNSVGASRAAVLQVTFSEPPDCDSLNAGAAVVEQYDPHPRLGGASATVGGEWACATPSFVPEDPTAQVSCEGSPSPCIATFTPAADPFLFEYSSHVSITLQGGPRPADTNEPMPVESTRATARGGQLAETVTISFRVADPPPLFVAGIEPGLSTTGFALDGAMQVRFSEPPALALAADCTGRGFDPAAIIVVEETYDAHPRLAGLTSPRAVTGAYACTVPAAGAEGPAACADDPAADPCTVTFTPDSPFEYSSQVSVVVAGVTLTPGVTPSAIDGLESIRATTYGGQLEADVSSSSRTLDPPPLAVIGSSPAAGAAMAPLDSSVEVTFSEGVLCDSISDATVTLGEELDPHPHYGGGAGITVTHTYALTCVDGDAVVLFNPDIELQYSSRVTLTLAGGAYPGAVESARATTLGGQLAQSVALSFRAYDPPALAITGTWPSPGALGVNVASPISVTFAEEVDCAGVSDTSFAVSELTDGGTTIDHTCAFTCAGGVVTCDPSQDFGLTSTVPCCPSLRHRTAACRPIQWSSPSARRSRPLPSPPTRRRPTEASGCATAAAARPTSV